MNKRQRLPKGQSKKYNSEKLATQGTQDEENKPKAQRNMKIGEQNINEE